MMCSSAVPSPDSRVIRCHCWWHLFVHRELGLDRDGRTLFSVFCWIFYLEVILNGDIKAFFTQVYFLFVPLSSSDCVWPSSISSCSVGCCDLVSGPAIIFSLFYSALKICLWILIVLYNVLDDELHFLHSVHFGRANNHLYLYKQFSPNVCLDCERKPEYLEKTHAFKLYSDPGIEPRTLLLWGDCAHHYTTVPPCSTLCLLYSSIWWYIAACYLAGCCSF